MQERLVAAINVAPGSPFHSSEHERALRYSSIEIVFCTRGKRVQRPINNTLNAIVCTYRQSNTPCFANFLGVEAGDPDPEPETQATQHSGPLCGGARGKRSFRVDAGPRVSGHYSEHPMGGCHKFPCAGIDYFHYGPCDSVGVRFQHFSWADAASAEPVTAKPDRYMLEHCVLEVAPPVECRLHISPV